MAVTEDNNLKIAVIGLGHVGLPLAVEFGKILPVLVPDLDYAGMEVASGTDAMEAWHRLISLPSGKEKDLLRKSMLEYCELDTFAMVRIFEFMEEL